MTSQCALRLVLGLLLKPMMPLFVGAANARLTKCGLKTIS